MEILRYALRIGTAIALIYTYKGARSHHTAFLLGVGLATIGLDVGLLEYPQWFRTAWPLALWLNNALPWLFGLSLLTYLARSFWPYPLLVTKPEEILRRGTEYWDCGRFEQAIQCYRQVLAQDSRCPHARCGLGWSFLMVGRFEAARDQFMKASRSCPDFTNAYSGLAAANLRLKKPLEAETAWKAALETAPDGLYARVALGLLFLQMDRQEEGRAMLAPVLSIDDPMSVKRQVAVVLAELGRAEDIPAILDWVRQQSASLQQQQGSVSS